MSFFLLTMQSYGDFLPIPRNFPNSSLICSDNSPHRRHIRQMPSESVVSDIEGTVTSVTFLCVWLWTLREISSIFEGIFCKDS